MPAANHYSSGSNETPLTLKLHLAIYNQKTLPTVQNSSVISVAPLIQNPRAFCSSRQKSSVARNRCCLSEISVYFVFLHLFQSNFCLTNNLVLNMVSVLIMLHL